MAFVENAAAPPDPPAGPAPAKAHLRERVRAARRARTPAEREDADRALAAVALAAPPVAALPAGAVVAAYASTPTEPGTGALRTALRARGLVVLLPVVTAADAALDWRVDEAEGSGVTAALEQADVVLLPALAVDAGGVRLGQGGGHYDRTLAALQEAEPARRPLLVAVVHAEEVLPDGAVPAEPHDVRVDAVLTPTSWQHLPGGGCGQ